jgi:hypothetical protein
MRDARASSAAAGALVVMTGHLGRCRQAGQKAAQPVDSGQGLLKVLADLTDRIRGARRSSESVREAGSRLCSLR